ncbi:hypothetical protein UJ101_01416 [Flavobacteriaceae bacterium UJ101]|nr:hypothetical protein UJ101_01416 [Flavobacteriaceae bacterium UJ101]
MRKIKLIWDFHGPDAKGIAEHHVIHLKEFAEKEHLEVLEFGEEMLSEKHFTAYMAVLEKDMLLVRDTLRPHRGELFN